MKKKEKDEEDIENSICERKQIVGEEVEGLLVEKVMVVCEWQMMYLSRI